MSRYLMIAFVVVAPITACVLTGFFASEAVVVFLFGSVSLGFLGWMVVERFRASFLRCLAFWWISKLLDKPELIYWD